jgi:hypothetical protein
MLEAASPGLSQPDGLGEAAHLLHIRQQRAQVQPAIKAQIPGQGSCAGRWGTIVDDLTINRSSNSLVSLVKVT